MLCVQNYTEELGAKTVAPPVPMRKKVCYLLVIFYLAFFPHLIM